MTQFVKTKSGLRISIRHLQKVKDVVVVIAPGFFQSKETKTFKAMEKDLSPYLDIISMDFRGHGKSEGRYTFSAYEKEDLEAVIEYAHQHYKKVGVLGFSYGGAVAIITQAQLKNISSLVCVGSPAASEEIRFQWWHPENIRIGIFGFESGKGVRPGNPFLKKFRPIDLVFFETPAPILFIHGQKDFTVRVSNSHALHERAKEPKEIIIFDKGGHAEELYKKYPKKFITIVRDWFLKTLDGA
jgi:pimeloyl-ACP methyl ester carboxylesterase